MTTAELIVANYDWMLRTAMWLCGNKADAYDMAQDAALRMLSKGCGYDPRKPFRAFAKVVLCNICKSRFVRNSQLSLEAIEIGNEPPTSVGADQSARLHDILRIIRRTARECKGLECVLLYAKGYGYQEIAAKLGIPTGTVMSRISAGRKALARELLK